MRPKKEYDAIIIGGGHMGITLGAYLQRAGMQTAIFERRHEEGSAIFSSECTAPGFIHNLHAQYMEYLDWMPMWHDFNLPQFGARTIYPTAQAGIAFSDGRPPVIIYSVEKEEHYEKTRKSVSQYSKHDAETLIGLIRKLQERRGLFAKGLYSPPPIPTPDNPEPDLANSYEALRQLGFPTVISKMSYKDAIDYTFESDEVRALFYRIAVEWGPGLEIAGRGASWLLFFPQLFNWRLMVGGTHTLAHAMEMAAVKEGMDFFESSEVVKVLLEKGKATGVQLKDGTKVKAKKLVASNADIKGTMLRMVGEDNLSPYWVKRIKAFEIGPSFILASTGLALHEAPDYKSAKWNPDINKTFYTVVGFDTAAEMEEYCMDAATGRIPRIPGAGTWVNSLWDPTYAPPGKHCLTGWFFFPKVSTQTPEQWEEVRRTYNDRFIRHAENWAPNLNWDNVIDHYFYTPLDMEKEMGLMEGDFCNGGSKPSQTVHNRPFLEASQYRTEIKDLYLCGPFTHPFGGASGACGYNCFKIIAEDFGLDKFWEKLDRGY